MGVELASQPPHTHLVKAGEAAVQYSIKQYLACAEEAQTQGAEHTGFFKVNKMTNLGWLN